MASLPLYVGRGRRVIGSHVEVPDDIFPELNKLRWHRNTNGYIRSNKGGYLHQVAYRLYYGAIPKGMEVDHKDRNKDNISRDNLRAVTRSVNGANKGVIRSNASGYAGVSHRVTRSVVAGRKYEHHYWHAQIKKNGVRVLSRDFPFTPEGLLQAAREVNRQYAIHFPEVAAPNPGVGL